MSILEHVTPHDDADTGVRSTKEIAELTGLSVYAVRKQLRAMCKEGYVELIPLMDADTFTQMRGTGYVLTEAGINHYLATELDKELNG